MMAELHYEVMKGGVPQGAGVTKADFRRKKGLLDSGSQTLEDAGYTLLDPETGKAMKLDAPEEAPVEPAAKKKGE